MLGPKAELREGAHPVCPADEQEIAEYIKGLIRDDEEEFDCLVEGLNENVK